MVEVIFDIKLSYFMLFLQADSTGCCSLSDAYILKTVALDSVASQLLDAQKILSLVTQHVVGGDIFFRF